MVYNSPEERVDLLIAHSDAIYTAIDKDLKDESVARRVLKLGVYSAAEALEATHATSFVAGDYVHALLNVYASSPESNRIIRYAYPRYTNIRDNLPPPMRFRATKDLLLKSLTQRYAETTRATRDKAGNLETDDRHSVHLTALALTYAAQYYPELDQAKLALYGILHDILEAYTGDVPTLTVNSEVITEKNKREVLALETLTKEFTVSYPRFVQLIHDYEMLSDDEAKFIKTFDKIDPGFTHLHNKGLVLVNDLGIQSEVDLHFAHDAVTARMFHYANQFDLVMDDRSEIHQRVAEQVNWPIW